MDVPLVVKEAKLKRTSILLSRTKEWCDEVDEQEVCVIHFDITQWYHGGTFKERKRSTQTKRYRGIQLVYGRRSEGSKHKICKHMKVGEREALSVTQNCSRGCKILQCIMPSCFIDKSQKVKQLTHLDFWLQIIKEILISTWKGFRTSLSQQTIQDTNTW
jgi:hypothetical protein